MAKFSSIHRIGMLVSIPGKGKTFAITTSLFASCSHTGKRFPLAQASSWCRQYHQLGGARTLRASSDSDVPEMSARGRTKFLNCAAGCGIPFSPLRVHDKRNIAWFSTSAAVFKEALPESSQPLRAVAGDPASPETAFVVPEPPPVPVISPDSGELILQAPTSDLSALGLGGWYPSGLLQHLLDFMHSSGLPWWGAIAAVTVLIRVCIFPLVLKAQRNAANMQQNLPEMQRIQFKMNEGRLNGDSMAVASAAGELRQFMDKNQIKPFRSLLPMLAQTPIFISVFVGLRQMANAPVASMKEGGLWWFTDLTVPDPYYILPVLTCATLYAVIATAAETGGMQQQQSLFLKYGFRAIPLIMLPFIANFPAALCCYWFTTNVMSLIQVNLLLIPKLRQLFNLPPIIKHKPTDLPMTGQKKGMRESFRESMQNNRIIKEIEDRARVDSVTFRQAGMEPIKKTFKYDPTKVRVENGEKRKIKQ